MVESAIGYGPRVNEVYARINATSTVAISEPTSADCSACNTTTGLKSAVFRGAAQNGEKVFFLTEQELLPGQTGMNLYEYDFKGEAGKKISLVSAGSTTPEVQGVARVSQDGSHVYFVAKGVLTGTNAEGVEPQAGADNLYVYEPDSNAPETYHVVFIASLLTEAERSGLQAEEQHEQEELVFEQIAKQCTRNGTIVEAQEMLLRLFGIIQPPLTQQETECFFNAFNGGAPPAGEIGTKGPSGTLAEDESLWRAEDVRPVEATPDGGFLVFPSSAHLVKSETNTSVPPQLFRYDAETGTLVRVSVGEKGINHNGNVNTFADSPHVARRPPNYAERDGPAEMNRVTVSEDGTVFFESSDALVGQATQNANNVYEYRDGHVYLISDGSDASLTHYERSVGLFGADTSGADVFFQTRDQLVPQDGDTQVDFYDARVDGGFPAPVLSAGCLGETCRGSTGVTPQLGSAGSATQAGGGNVVPSMSKPSRKARPPTRAQKRAKALRACRKKRNKKERAACERRVMRRYAAKSRATRTMKRYGTKTRATKSDRMGL